MKDKGNYEIEGIVTELLPNTMFRVEVTSDKRLIIATLKGKLRRAYVKVMPGDRVKVELTPYDENRGRIVFKFK
ncbi:translation initiation factor IF-1 [Candidatus Microgenomates bacterium]|nr:translation initiation factor IF-1 [Candidatus Microgenomates bacterium]